MQRVAVRLKARQENYDIKIGANLLSRLGEEARASLGSDTLRIALVSNHTVFDLYGERATRSLVRAGFTVSTWLMKDGERNKSLQSFEQALRFLNQSGLQRNDCVVSLGGGVVGDLAGFAAATYLRGISFVHVPTTLLAQIDASVGGKTGINTPAGKNLVGAFHHPRLVVIDTDTLQTLPSRELTAGWCEAIKQGAVGDRKLFDQTVRMLRRGANKNLTDAKRHDELVRTVAAHCRFKASIVSKDEREDITREDRYSRRILNFGHTTGHALEVVTEYRRFRHGEAVGYGMLVAGEISKSLGMLGAGELELLREGVRACGPLPRAHDIEVERLIKVMNADKKSVAGHLKWVLLEQVGRARIVDAKEIDARTLKTALRAGLSR